MKQKEKIQELLRLIEENPDLEIMPRVDSDVCNPDYGWTLGSWGKAEVDEYWVNDGRIYLRSDDEDEVMDDVMENIWLANEAENLPDARPWEELEKQAKEIIKWKKAIFVRINTL